MYRIMEDWTDIRERVASGKVSKRAILRETGMHWKTLKKILTHSEPPGYRLRQARPKQKLGPVSGAHRTDPQGEPTAAAQAAAYRQAGVGAAQGRGFHRRLHGGEGGGAGTHAAQPGSVCAAGALAALFNRRLQFSITSCHVRVTRVGSVALRYTRASERLRCG